MMIYCSKFRYHTSLKTVENEPDLDEEREYENVLVGFIHLEAEDEANLAALETKLVKNLKWAARKNGTDGIVLHSFAHLSESKASPHIVKGFLDGAQARLAAAGYRAFQTPFGYFLDLELAAPGRPSARIFKAL